MTANASPAVLAPVDVNKALATLDREIAELAGVSCMEDDNEAEQRGREHGLREARAAVEQMAADLAAAREERRVALEWIAEAEAKAATLRQRVEAAEADAATLRTELDKMTAQAINAMARLTTQALQEPRK